MARPLPSLTVGTQNVGGMRTEFQLRQGKKHSLLRTLVHNQTDFLILTEVRADSRCIRNARIKWGLKPTLHSLHHNPHGGVVIFSRPGHILIDGSIRESDTQGHIAAGVYEVRGSRIVVAGYYGESASNDRTSADRLHELHNIIRELKHVYRTTHVLIAGDFNVSPTYADSNNPNHISKPRTARLLRTMMEDHDLHDLAQTANKPWHTWFRKDNSGQSSRIDLILTSMTVGDLQVNSILHFLDHAFLTATFGQPRVTKTYAMKDYILGSDEFLINAHEYIDSILTQHDQDPSLPPIDNDDLDDSTNRRSVDQGKLLNNPITGHSALHTFNSIINNLHKAHNTLAKHKAKQQADRLREPSCTLVKLKKNLKKEKNIEEKNRLHEQICEIQKNIQDDIEAKDQASQMRISNFYKHANGRMVPESFSCIKELKRDRGIHKLQHEGQTITDPDIIVEVMQKWYENTASQGTTQTLTLTDFLLEQNIILPQLTDDEASDLEEEFSVDEVKQAIAEAKVVSAPGPSGQTISFYKLLFMHIPNLMTQALNQLVFVPKLSSSPCFQWIQERKVVYIPKKPDPTGPGDYRPLSMLEVLYKIPARILSRRLTQVLPKLIGPHQHGFMPQKGIQEPSILATHLIEEANKNNKPLQLVSFDIEKAFDKVGHSVIIQALRAFGIPETIVQALHQYTLVGFARVEVNGRQGLLITIKNGSGQGDPLSSILFLLATEPLNRALVQRHTNVMYRTDEGLTAGPQLFADDNQLPLSLTTSQQITPIIDTYDDFRRVSGLNVNINKTAALCINTPEAVIRGFNTLGINTPEHIKHLGIHLGKTLESTIQETMRQIEPKAIKRRILATTPPTDLLHRAMLIKSAFIPIYNHVFMAIPVSSIHSDNLFDEIRHFLWTRQKDGETVQKRIRVSKKRVSADIALGGLGIQHPADTIIGFQQNLIQRILQKNSRQIPSLLPELLEGLLRKIGRPSLEHHILHLGPVQWRITGRKLTSHNTMLGQSFKSLSTLLEWYETDPESWHCAAIDGHASLANGTLMLSPIDSRILLDHGIITVSQLYEESATGGLSRTVNLALIDRLAINQPWLRTKLRALTNILNGHNLSHTDKYILTLTTGSLLVKGEKHLSQLHRKSNAKQLLAEIQIAPSYASRARDGVYRPDEKTFKDAYKIVDIPELPSKTKESAFEVLNRTIWTNNKAFKSGMVDSPNCERCGEIETMEHLILNCDHYSALLWEELSTSFKLAIQTMVGHDIACINLTPREIIFNAPHPSIILHIPDKTSRLVLIMLVQEIRRNIIFRRMNLTGSDANITPLIRIQAHLLASIQKLRSYLEYQGTCTMHNALHTLHILHQTITNRII